MLFYCLLYGCTVVLLMIFCLFFFFFKQKTAYEMRISDWSSDVCSSDLQEELAPLASRIEPIVDEGETGSVVMRQLERTRSPLLVLGTHGRSGFVHATIGSQAEALLSAVSTDVLDRKSTRLNSSH